MPLFASPATLRRRGVLGINKRNADIVMRYNQRRFYPLVDDKLATKKLALAAGIAVPDLYGVIEIQQEIRNLGELVNRRDEFVIKPARGTGGNGILVIAGRFGDHFRKPTGELVSLATIGHHISNILGGMYSLGGVQDKTIIEYRVKPDPVFEAVSYQGVPDIRIILFRGVPVAAMLRLPTSASDGKANLHQGALGVGVDLVTGRCRGGVLGNRPQSLHPDTAVSTSGIRIPQWRTILALAIRCADMVKLGYIGVDIVLDATLGPLILELNARPGLNVQIANRQGLNHGIRAVAALQQLPADTDDRVALAQKLAQEIVANPC